MSLRDWFAGMALQGLLVTQYSAPNHKVIEWAYQFADGMIAARERKEGGA